MTDAVTVAISEQGTIELPLALMQSHSLKPGDTLTIQDLGGLLVLRPTLQSVNDIAARMEKTLLEREETLESILQTVRENREGYQFQVDLQTTKNELQTKQIRVQSYVGADGLLKIQLPVDVIEADIDVLITIQPFEAELATEGDTWPENFFERTAGQWQGEPLVRPPQGEFETRLNLK